MMLTQSGCPFCKILEQTRAGRNPYALAETPTSLIVLDKNQLVIGRTVVIGKLHFRSTRDRKEERQFAKERNIVSRAVCSALGSAGPQTMDWPSMHSRFFIHPVRSPDEPHILDSRVTCEPAQTLDRQKLNDLKVVIQQALLALIHPDDKTWSLFKLHLTQNSPSELPARP